MIVLYRLLFVPLFVVLLPYYLRRMWRRGGYRRGAGHRFGFVPPLDPPQPHKTRLWLQAVSVGELQAIEPLLDRLREAGNWEVVLTTTTSTGYRLAHDRLASKVTQVAVFPLDLWPCNALAWQRFQPDVVALMEGEVWPEHLHQARRRNVPTLLINARLSDHSYARYRKFGKLPQRLFRGLTRILASSELDAERFRHLVGDPDRIEVTGNLKFDAGVGPQLSVAERQTLAAEMGFAKAEEPPRVLLGCSTWPGEEAFLLSVLDEAEVRNLPVRLVLIPRHAERRGEVSALLRMQPRLWHARTSKTPAPQNVRIYLADTTGEMRRLMQLADVAFIGKSLPPNDGGQTPLECAAFGIAMAYGPHMSNFRQACRELEHVHGSLRGAHTQAVREHLLELLANPEQCAAMGQRAQSWHAACRGATERTVEALKSAARRHLPQEN
ncbi:MAG: 3-deoxy-D-manno-octulosonic acid transferase [Opitutales bacterium]